MVARSNPLRFMKEPPALEDLFNTIRGKVERFNVDKIKQEDIVASGSGAQDEEKKHRSLAQQRGPSGAKNRSYGRVTLQSGETQVTLPPGAPTNLQPSNSFAQEANPRTIRAQSLRLAAVRAPVEFRGLGQGLFATHPRFEISRGLRGFCKQQCGLFPRLRSENRRRSRGW